MKCIRTVLSFCLALLVLLPPLPARAEQKCRDNIRAGSPDASFILHDDGTATQKTTGLMWMRCDLGQQWNGWTCSGTASSLGWREALNAAALQKFANHDDWRLPNKNELESIVEPRCASPAVNARVFPATPAVFHWTSTPYVGLATGAWSVDLGFGAVTATEKTGRIAARLVRDGE